MSSLKTETKSKETKNLFTVFTITQIAACVALLCVSAFISIPVPFSTVPITLQTFMVILIANLLKPAYALIAQVVYTLLGILGLPVFSGGTSGIGHIFAPGGGFIVGFIAAAYFVSLAKGKNENIIRCIIVSIVVGISCVDIFGIIFYAVFAGADLISATVLMVLPYIAGDIVKCIAAALIASALRKALKKANIGF